MQAIAKSKEKRKPLVESGDLFSGKPSEDPPDSPLVD
jgi:hypothetical protein